MITMIVIIGGRRGRGGAAGDGAQLKLAQADAGADGDAAVVDEAVRLGAEERLDAPVAVAEQQPHRAVVVVLVGGGGRDGDVGVDALDQKDGPGHAAAGAQELGDDGGGGRPPRGRRTVGGCGCGCCCFFKDHRRRSPGATRRRRWRWWVGRTGHLFGQGTT